MNIWEVEFVKNQSGNVDPMLTTVKFCGQSVGSCKRVSVTSDPETGAPVLSLEIAVPTLEVSTRKEG